MAQITALIAGPNKNFDYQVTALARTILNPGVLSSADLLVSTNSVAAGEAFLLCTRGNGQKIMVHFQNTAAVTIDTNGTKKVWVGISQAIIDDGSSNAIDGTGIATIQTGASYPVSGAYIPLASIASGTITDARVVITNKALLSEGFPTDKTKYIDPTTGNEIIKDTTQVSTLSDSDVIISRSSDGNEKRGLFSSIKNQLGTAGKYIQTVLIGEALGATNTIPDAIPNLTSNTGNLDYITSASTEYPGDYSSAVAFNDNLANGWAANGVTTNQWIKVVMPVARIFNAVSLMYWSSGEIYSTGWKIQGSNDGTNWTDLYTSTAPVPGAYTKYTFANTTPYTQYRFFGATGATGSNPGLKRINFDEVSASPVPISVVGAIQYPITLTANTGTSFTNMGIAFSVPYACKIRTVKSWANASSGSAKIQLRDNSGTLLTEQTVTSGTNSCDLNYDIAANTTYRLVLNDTVNFGNTGYYTAGTTFVTYFPYATAGVYNAVTNDTNYFSFSEINLDFLGKAFKARANRSMEIPFAVFAGFANGPKSVGDSVELNGNEYSYIEGFSGLTKGDIIYVSNIAGAMSTTKGTVKNPIGQAVSSSGIVLKKTPNSVDNVISYSLPNAGIGVTNYGAIGWHYGGLCSYTVATSTGYIGASMTLQWSGDGITNWKNIVTASGNQTLQESCSLPTGYIRGMQTSQNSSNASSITVTN